MNQKQCYHDQAQNQGLTKKSHLNASLVFAQDSGKGHMVVFFSLKFLYLSIFNGLDYLQELYSETPIVFLNNHYFYFYKTDLQLC